MTGQKMHRVLLVPSCGISPVDRLTPGDTLFRCERALEAWRTGEYTHVLCTGGIFNPPDIQTVAAATLMGYWFLERGVPDAALVIEDRSLDTYENVAFALRALCARLGCEPYTITVITQWQHALRFFFSFFFGHGRLVELKPIHQPISWKTWMWEWVFIIYHLIDWRGTFFIARRNRDSRRQA